MDTQKKIIIFTCTGGHTSVANALKEYLHDTYETHIVNIFTDVLAPIDFVHKITSGKYNSENLYNILLQKRWHRIINHLLLNIGYANMAIQKKKMGTLIHSHLSQESPDAIISVIPFFNNYFLSFAQHNDIPFILIPTDLDGTTFVYGMQKPRYKNFHLAKMIKSPILDTTLSPLSLPDHNTHLVGPIIKKSFFSPPDKDTIKAAYMIPDDKIVILLLMGSQGSAATYEFCKELAKIKKPFHLIVVSGKNPPSIHAVQSVLFPTYISTTILGFVDTIPDLMAIADILITKSGGASIIEALATHLPMILDMRLVPLVWEKANQKFIIQNKLGVAVTHTSTIVPTVTQFLNNPDLITTYKKRIETVQTKEGGDEIRQLLGKIMG